jgi:hypothetical protein
MCVVDRPWSTYSRFRAELQQREEESDANQGKIQDLESRLQEAETQLAEMPTLKQSIQTLETSQSLASV